MNTDKNIKTIISAQDNASVAVSAINQKFKQLDTTADGVSRRFTELNAATKAMAGAMTGLAGAGALAALFKSSVDTADQLSKMSQKFGVAIEQLSGMSHAANLADVSMEQLGKGMGKLAKGMYEVAEDNNSGPAKTFQALGISVTDAAGKLRGTDAVMMDVAERFANMKDGAGKAALAMEIFGKGGADLIPMLNSGRTGIKEVADEARRFGVVLTAEAGKQAEEFNDNLTRMKTKVSGVAMAMFNEMGPAINSIIDGLAKGGDVNTSPLVVMMRKLSDLTKNTQREAVTMIATFDKMNAWVDTGGALGHLFSKDKAAEYGRQMKIINDAQAAQLKEIYDPPPAAAKPPITSGGSDEPPIVKSIKSAEKAAKAAGKSLVEEYKKQAQELFTSVMEIHDAYAAAIQGEGQAFALSTTIGNDLKTDRYKVTPFDKYRLLTNDQYSIPQITDAPPSQLDGMDAAINAKSAEQAVAMLNGQYEKSRSLEIDLLSLEYKRAELQGRDFELPLITAKQKELALLSSDSIAFGWKETVKGWDDTAKQLANISSATAEGMQASFENLFFDTMEGKLKSFADYFNVFASEIQRAAAKMLSESLISNGSDWIKSGISLMGGMLGGGSASGGSNYTLSPGPTYTATTPSYSLMPKKSFAVGTNYVPYDMVAQIHKGEAIIPAAYNTQGTGGGNTSIYVPVTIYGEPSKQKASELRAEIEATVERVMRRVI